MAEVDNILEKCKALRREYDVDGTPAARAQIKAWEKSLMKEMRRGDLLKHEEIRHLVETLVKQVEGIKYLLSSDETLTTEQRHALFADKKAYERVLRIFTPNDSVIREIEEKINESL